MPQYSAFNVLDQFLDIAGTDTSRQDAGRSLSDESGGLGAPISGQTGISASIDAVVAGVVSFSGGSGFSSNSVGNFITIGGASNPANDGTFLITEFVSPSSIKYANASGFAPDLNNPNIHWTERKPYCIGDDLNFSRTDRQAIKGVGYDNDVPTYVRPDATNVFVPANLANMAGKTTDASFLHVNRVYRAATVLPASSYVTVVSPGNLKHAKSASFDVTGVPCFDVAPYVGSFHSCFVDILDTSNGASLTVLAGLHAGEKIFGVTREGASTSPNSVEIEFFSCPVGQDIASSSTSYIWEVSQSSVVNFNYGYGERIDSLDVDAVRTSSPVVSGMTEYEHQNLDTLTHWVDQDSYDEIIRTAGKVTHVVTWDSPAKSLMLREEIITRTAGKVSQLVTIQYSRITGMLKETETENFARTAGKVTSISRTRVP